MDEARPLCNLQSIIAFGALLRRTPLLVAHGGLVLQTAEALKSVTETVVTIHAPTTGVMQSLSSRGMLQGLCGEMYEESIFQQCINCERCRHTATLVAIALQHKRLSTA